jgi:hypothetical protein
MEERGLETRRKGDNQLRRDKKEGGKNTGGNEVLRTLNYK